MIPAFEQAGLVVLERGWLSSNNVLFGHAHPAQEPVLVDSGYCTHAEQTVALVGRLLGPRRLGRIVNTHLHSDHCGGNAALQAAHGCAIDVPAGEAAKVDAWDEDALTYRATGQQCPRFTRTGVLVPGTDIVLGPLPWRVIGSPGHDPESVVLHQPALELLISADALWENGFGIVFPELEGERGFEAVRATLAEIRRLRIQAVIPGHGPVFTDVAGALDRAERRLDAQVADPLRHARHAAKVLLKYHLMEQHRESRTNLFAWLGDVRLIRTVHARHFAAMPFDGWCEELLAELVANGALRIEGDAVANA